MCRMNTPPVVCKYIEDAKNENKECCRPFGFKSNGNHYASSEANNWNKNTHNSPFSLNNEAKEKENKKHTTRKEETRITMTSVICKDPQSSGFSLLFFTVCFTDCRQSSK